MSALHKRARRLGVVQQPGEDDAQFDARMRTIEAAARQLREPIPDLTTSFVSRVQVADFMERYAERLVAGPATREFAHPINRNHHDPEIATAVRKVIYALAQAVRTGVDQAEADWPQAVRS